MPDPHAPFLAAIIARQDDDLPRLIYADALEKGDEFPSDAERAEFIRVQVELARLPQGPFKPVGHGMMVDANEQKRRDLRCRDEELRRLWSSKWFVVPGLVARWEEGSLFGWIPGERRSTTPRNGVDIVPVIRRGFVEVITCSWPDFCRHADAIRAATPLRRAKLTTAQLWENGRTKFARTEQPGVYTHADFPGLEFELDRLAGIMLHDGEDLIRLPMASPRAVAPPAAP